MLMKNLQIKLIGPPVLIGGAAARGVVKWALGFCCHSFLLILRERNWLRKA